ncbi:hypothetical protein TcWFU_000700 [Taenia crassiceps]|uniref:Alpha-macroglobulin receptor-binding domain-containing protein n=1 Tax=Taenia crassiceps TaxID=6207 RepID=A0ABR4Q4P9_9CEST
MFAYLPVLVVKLSGCPTIVSLVEKLDYQQCQHVPTPSVHRLQRPTRAKSTGMLLVTVQLPSGWIVTKSELVKVPHNADVMKVEPDAHKQEVSVYFNGFQEEDGDAERCFTVPLHQRILVQEAQPGLVTAHDYYNPQEIVQALLHLNSCQLYWDSMHEINA